MMNKLILLFALCVTASALAFAEDVQQVITLKDGSQIKGALAGIENGVYTVKTPIIGDVHVAASDVASITNGSAASTLPSANNTAPAVPNQAPTSAPNLDQQVAAAQQRLMSNPQSAEILQKMAENPEVVQALADPALQQAVMNRDYQAVAKNPAIQKLMNDPSMQALVQQMSQQNKQQSSQ